MPTSSVHSTLLTAPGPAVAGFSPTSLSLSGYWRASYSGSPWVATASAGTSGSNGSLTEATNPPATGSALNGFTPASFNGTNSVLHNANGISSFISTTGYSLGCLFNMTAAGASSVGADFAEAQFFSDDFDAFIYFSFSTRGVTAGHWDGSVFREATKACGTGAWHVAQVWFVGGNIHVEVDGVEGTPTAAGNAVLSGTGKPRVGRNNSGTVWLNGLVAELYTATSDIGATSRSNYRQYIDSRYALSL